MSDLIVREDAIMALRLEYPMMPLFKSLREEWAIKTEGFRKAEEVIMRLPSVDVPTTATGTIDAIREAEYRGYMKAVEKRPKGKWIYCEDDSGHDGYKCSECGYFVPWCYDAQSSDFIWNYNFCPHCNADMRESKDFQVIVNGNCTKCGKPLSGNRIFICEECEEQSKESYNERLGGERRSHKGNR